MLGWRDGRMVSFSGAAVVGHGLSASALLLRDVCPMSQSAATDGRRKESGHEAGSRLGHSGDALNAFPSMLPCWIGQASFISSTLGRKSIDGMMKKDMADFVPKAEGFNTSGKVVR